MGEATSYTKEGVDALIAGLGNIVTQEDLDAAVAALVDSSPAVLNTLNELAAALGNDPNFATTITTSLATKASQTDLSTVQSGAMGVVLHGTDPNVARPTGYGAIHWIGTVEPVNSAESDLWTNA